jgi:dUTP pyrophosphatase
MCYLCDLTTATLKVKKLNPNAILPKKREEDSGYDIYGIFDCPITLLAPNESIIIPTGISMEFPKGLGFILCNRGSVGTRGAIVGAHVIDSGYRGEVFIDLHNISHKHILITDNKISEIDKTLKHETVTLIPKSSPIAQGLIIPTLHLHVEETDILSDSLRKEGALGSTNL